MEELALYLQEKSKEYWNESNIDDAVDKIPTSIVDFVIESFLNACRFPPSYDDDKKYEILKRYKNTMAMACVDIFAKAGMEGQKSHRESDMTLEYDEAWINPKLFKGLPNFVNAPY